MSDPNDGSSRHIAYDFGDDGKALVQATLHDDGTMSFETVWLPARDSAPTTEGGDG